LSHSCRFTPAVVPRGQMIAQHWPRNRLLRPHHQHRASNDRTTRTATATARSLRCTTFATGSHLARHTSAARTIERAPRVTRPVGRVHANALPGPAMQHPRTAHRATRPARRT
jgi:hypothetical protein